MEVKVILINFQEEYLKKSGKWFTKSTIDKFVMGRFLPFCDRHQISYYLIKSDYSQPNNCDREGCVPGTPGFKSLIKLSQFAGPAFTKADDSPNFIREGEKQRPIENSSAFKKWLDENIGNPKKFEYIVLAGMGIESSITLIGNELTRYGYNVRVLKEGSAYINKKYTTNYENKFPMYTWGEMLPFSKFVTEYNKFIKKPTPEVEDEIVTDEEEAPAVEETKETELFGAEPKKPAAQEIQIPSNLSKAETIALMKEQMKAQYFTADKVAEENAVNEPEEFPKEKDFADSKDIDPVSYDFNDAPAEPEITFTEPEPEPIVEPQPQAHKSLKEQQEDALEAARRRVAAYYGLVDDEPEAKPEPEPIVEPEPVVQPQPQPVVQQPRPVAQPQPIVQPEPEPEEEIDIFADDNDDISFDFLNDLAEEPPVVPHNDPTPVVREERPPVVTKSEADEYKYMNVYNSMIEIENEYYDSANDATPISFVKSKIYAEGGKAIKPKAKPTNKMSVHEKYMLLGEQKRKAYALRGEKYKPDNGVDESLR